MRTFKIIDCWASVIWIILFASASIIYHKNGLLNETLLNGYFVVGLWQILSMCVHAVTGHFTRRWGTRYIYHWITFIAVITIPAGSFWILYVAAPFMAIYYTYLCFRETYIKMKRPMDLLK